MAGQPLQAVLLVGLGYRELSMAPSAIPRVKEALRAVRAAEARALAARALELASGGEIEALVREALPTLAQVTTSLGGHPPSAQASERQ